jgi:hypothetical protein
MTHDQKKNETEFKAENFWEALYARPLEKAELAEIDVNAKAFIKLMLEEQLLEKRRKLQVEIYKIDCELEDLAKNIFPIMNLETAIQKFESSLPKTKSENKI